MEKRDAADRQKIQKKSENIQKADLHQTLYIPHGFDVFAVRNVKKYRKLRGEKGAFLRSRSDFGPPKRRAK